MNVSGMCQGKKILDFLLEIELIVNISEFVITKNIVSIF